MTLHGQGANEDRKAKSKMTSGIRELTEGGIPMTVGDRDLEHCALDHLLNRGYIDKDEYDSGYRLRELYYSFNQTGKWVFDGKGGHEPEHETDADRARQRYNNALKSVGIGQRGIIQHVCIEAVAIPTYYTLINEVISGLEDLTKFFKKS